MGGFYGAIARGVSELAGKVGGSVAAKEGVESLVHNIIPAETAFKDIPVAKTLYDHYKQVYEPLADKLHSEGIVKAQQQGLSIPVHEIRRKAQQDAQTAVFGQNRVAIQGVLKHVEKTVSKNRADILADHLNILFKEAPDSQGLSKFDRDMRKSHTGAHDDIDGFQTKPSEYRGQNIAEQVIKKHQALLAYKAAIPHLSSNLNILISDGFKTYAKVVATALDPTSRKGAEAILKATNAVSEVREIGYRQKLEFDNSVIKKYAPGSVGEFIHRNMYIPGMSRVRYETLLMSANASKFAAEEAIQHLMKGDTRYAMPMLHELGLDAQKLIAQKGQILPDDLEKIYYHGTDARAFLQSGTSRSVLSQRSPMYRVTSAFHTYVTRQSQFFRKTFMRQYQQGDFVGIARNISLLSMAFPLVGASIYETERLLSGNDWDDPVGHFEKQINPKNTIENLSHIAAFGVVTGYMRGAARSNLTGQLLGPDMNMMIQGGQDALKALHTDSNHKDAWKALARDAMSDVPSLGLGSIASHKLLPTKKEEAAHKIKRFRRTKPKAKTWNPLNAE